MEQEFESEMQRVAHAITEWAYSGGEGRRRAVASILADVMMAVERGHLVEARELMSRLVVLRRFAVLQACRSARARGGRLSWCRWASGRIGRGDGESAL